DPRRPARRRRRGSPLRAARGDAGPHQPHRAVNRFVASQLRFRRGRALALAGGILVAGVAFTILTASAHTAAFHTRGTITRNYRTAYDILVRPHGSTTPLERREGLVRDNYLSGIYCGMSI